MTDASQKLSFRSFDDFRRDGLNAVAVSAPLEISQATIDAFAELTNDRQWIHVDVERARGESPFGATIAHGFLTLSMLTPLIESAVEMPPVRDSINYGFNKIRFVGPVRAGSSLVGRFRVAEIVEGDGFLTVTWDATVTLAGSGETVLAAQWLGRLYH